MRMLLGYRGAHRDLGRRLARAAATACARAASGVDARRAARGGDRLMRISAVRATPVNIPFHAPYRFSLGSTASVTKTIVEVATDEGVTGIGECADGDRSTDIMRLGERLVGLDPLDLNECERRCVPAFEHSLWEN